MDGSIGVPGPLLVFVTMQPLSRNYSIQIGPWCWVPGPPCQRGWIDYRLGGLQQEIYNKDTLQNLV